MKLQSFTAICAGVLSLSFAGSALAGEALVAKLQTPVAAKTKFIAGGAMFVCEADACVATTLTSQTYGSATCKTIAKAAGSVAGFSTSRKAFDADQVNACNAAVLPSTQVAKR